MAEKSRKKGKARISGMIREGLEGSWRSFNKLEVEGEKLVKGLVETLEKQGLVAGTKAVEDLGRDARAFLQQLNNSIEERAQGILEGLNVPTKEDLEQYNRKVKALIDENVTSKLEKLKVPTGKELDSLVKQLRGNMGEQIQKGLGRLNLATRKDVEAVSKDLKRLQKEVARLSKAGASKKAKGTAAKPAAKKTSAARTKAAKR